MSEKTTETPTARAPSTEASTAARIRDALQLARSRLEAAERVFIEPIAVVGMGCRFPGGADSPAALWERLCDGRDLTRELPADRWDVDALYSQDPTEKGKIYARRGGFLDSVDQFDAAFFHMSPREAESLDPQHRLVLEVAWEALQHARIAPATLASSLTGIFVGTGQNDYARRRLTAGVLEQIDVYDGTGNLPCFAAGRLGFCLGVQGPNLVVDAACASSLVALHLACQSLRLGECRAALAGGVHLVLSPEYTVFLSRAGVLAADGVTRTFDAAASGMVRGEGCGMVVLKRLADAQADGDNILALIRGSAVNHGGASGGLTVPSEQAQRDLIQAALTRSRVSPDDVGYLEAHGTGTALGDPIEVAAISSVFGAKRKTPLLIGSIKTNMGHLEYAAGIAGIIKTILMLGHGEIAPHLHFGNPNPAIPWNELALQVPTARQPWPDGYRKRIAGVSSFGMSGTNAHVILEQPPEPSALSNAGPISSIFQRERYFIAASSQRMIPTVAPADSPFFGARLRLPYSQETRFEQRLHIESYSYLADHMLHQQVVVAAASHVAMLIAAAQTTLASKPVVLEDIFFLAPLLLMPGKARVVQILVEPQKEARVPLKLLSRAEDGDDWLLHVTAHVGLSASAPPAPIDVGHAQHRFTDRQDGTSLYQTLRAGGFAMGTAFRWNRWYGRRDHEVLCCIERPAGLQDPPGCSLHPGLLDTCFQLQNLFQEIPAADALIDVPFHIARLRYFPGPDSSSRLYCWTQKEADHDSATSLRLFDERGVSLTTVTGLRFRKARASTLLRTSAEPNPLVYSLAWRPHPLVAAAQSAPGSYLIFMDREGVGEALGARLQRAGHAVVRVDAGSTYSIEGPGEAVVNPQEPADFVRLLGEATARRPVHGVLFLWGLARVPDQTGAIEMAGHETDLTFAALNLSKALVSAATGTRPRLIIATRVGWAAPPCTVPAGASLWGLGRVLTLEHPEQGACLIDVGDGAPHELCERLYSEMLTPDGETQVAYAASTRRVARMVPGLERSAAGADHAGAAAAPINPESSYLLTGGLGALGLGLAHWLVQQGARHLILNGRKPPTDQALQVLAELRSKGATVTIKPGDIGDPTFVHTLLAEVTTQGPPLRGIFHLAGVLRDLTLLNQTRSTIASVMRAKVAGAFNLHQLTRATQLDHFVCFSSIAAVLGSRGQGNYAAANACLDALMHHRRASGLPGLCVHWGAWEGAGMAALLDEPKRRRLAAQGLLSMSFPSGFDALDSLLTHNPVSALAQLLDWTLFPEAFFHGERPPLFAEIGRSPSAAPTPGPISAAPAELAAIRHAAPDQKPELLSTLVRNRVAAILRVASPEKLKPRVRLFDAGLDSMTALELHRDLEKCLSTALPQTLIFDYPTISALSSYLAEKVLGQTPASVPAPPGAALPAELGPELNALLGSINELSDEDLAKRLNRA